MDIFEQPVPLHSRSRSICLQAALAGLFIALILGVVQAEPLKSGIKLNKLGLEKRAAYSDERLDKITDIKFIKIGSDPSGAIGVAANRGAVFLFKNYRPQNTISFAKDETPIRSIEIVDTNGKGAYAFLGRAGWGAPIALWGSRGDRIWSYETEGQNDSQAVDINGDGLLEHIVASIRPSLTLLDKDGKVVWTRSRRGNTFHVSAADINTDGMVEIVTSQQDTIRFHGPDGNEIGEMNPGIGYIADFYLVRYPKADSKLRLMIPKDGQYLLFDLEIEALLCKLPGEYMDHVKTAPVRLRGDAEPYFAMVGEVLHQGGYVVGLEGRYSRILIYDSRKSLVYDEIFPKQDSGNAIMVRPRDAGKDDVLLVGGNGRIYEYSLATQAH